MFLEGFFGKVPFHDALYIYKDLFVKCQIMMQIYFKSLLVECHNIMQIRICWSSAIYYCDAI